MNIEVVLNDEEILEIADEIDEFENGLKWDTYMLIVLKTQTKLLEKLTKQLEQFEKLEQLVNWKIGK